MVGSELIQSTGSGNLYRGVLLRRNTVATYFGGDLPVYLDTRLDIPFSDKVVVQEGFAYVLAAVSEGDIDANNTIQAYSWTSGLRGHGRKEANALLIIDVSDISRSGLTSTAVFHIVGDGQAFEPFRSHNPQLTSSSLPLAIYPWSCPATSAPRVPKLPSAECTEQGM